MGPRRNNHLMFILAGGHRPPRVGIDTVHTRAVTQIGTSLETRSPYNLSLQLKAWPQCTERLRTGESLRAISSARL